MRFAVYSGACPSECYKEQDVERITNLIARRWEARVCSLVETKRVPKLMTEKDGWYAANCPPFGVHIAHGQKERRVCDLRICPFCWGRNVVRASFERIRPHVLGEKEGRTDYSLLSFQRIFRIQRKTKASNTVNFIRVVQEGRRIEVGLIPSDGAAVVSTIEIESDVVVIRRRGILLVPQEQIANAVTATTLLPVVGGGEPSHKLHENVDESQLVEIVSKTFSYPPTYLYGETEATAATLHWLKRHRLRAFYGILRQSKSKNHFLKSEETCGKTKRAKRSVGNR